MSNFSANTLIENIGALELGAVTYSLDDVGLEASVGPATPTGGAWTQVCCRRIDDGVLENASVTVMAGPTVAPCTVMTCPRRIDDATLEESAGTLYAGPTSPNIQCMASVQPFCPRRVDDSSLEASTGNLSIQPSGFTQPCPTFHSRCVDDGALEDAAAIAAAPSYNMGCSSTQGAMCRRIDDGALEASAGSAAMMRPSIQVCVTPHCPHIDDGELETVAAMTASPSFDSVCGSTVGPRCFRRIDDSALEGMVISAGPNLGPPTGRGWTGACCGRIDDSALEASVGSATPTGNAWTQVCCRRIDDSTN